MSYGSLRYYPDRARRSGWRSHQLHLRKIRSTRGIFPSNAPCTDSAQLHTAIGFHRAPALFPEPDSYVKRIISPNFPERTLTQRRRFWVFRCVRFFPVFFRSVLRTRSGSFFAPVSRFHSSNVWSEIFPSTRSCANLRL